MARSVKEIFDEINHYKDTALPAILPSFDNFQNFLADLNSQSKVAVWRLYIYIVSLAIHIHETLWDLYKLELDEKINLAITGTVEWYRQKMFQFQMGDVLSFDTISNTFKYPTIDSTKQIIKRCAIEELQNGIIRVKLARVNSSNQPFALSSVEVAAATSYLKKVRFAGTRFEIVSGAGDNLRIYYTIYHDAAVPQIVVSQDVEFAVNNFLGDLPFNGELNITALTDKLQNVQGVIDPVFNACFRGTFATASTASALSIPVDVSAIPFFGYFRIPNTFPLSSTFIYIAV